MILSSDFFSDIRSKKFRSVSLLCRLSFKAKTGWSLRSRRGSMVRFC
jgi:hypothetical protein